MKPRINLFDQIGAFYSFVFENQDKVRQSHCSLYAFLLNQNNRNNWSEWFKCPFDLAMAGACIGSKTTYYNCLEDLQKWKLIKWKKGENSFKAPQISILVLSKSVPLSVPQSEPLTEPLTEPLSVPLPEQLSVLLTGKKEILITNNYQLITDNIIKWIKNEIGESEKSKRFIPPTYKQVQEYCLERKNKVDPQKFVDFYTSKNWMVGKSKMKDWKASVRTWEGNQQNNNNNGTINNETKSNDLGAQADRIARGIFGSDTFGFTTSANESTEDVDYESADG